MYSLTPEQRNALSERLTAATLAVGMARRCAEQPTATKDPSARLHTYLAQAASQLAAARTALTDQRSASEPS